MADGTSSAFILNDPGLGCGLGCKGDHHRGVRSCHDNLDPVACAARERNNSIRGISVKVCIAHAANMACRSLISNPTSVREFLVCED